MTTRKTYMGLFFGLAMMAGAGGYAFALILSLPIVQYSEATNQCVRVIGGASNQHCGNLPAKYHHEWVK